MRIDVYHHMVAGSEVLVRLDALATKLDLIVKREEKLMSQLTDALDAAEKSAQSNSDADDAAEKLLVTLSALIADLRSNTTDPATVLRITALSDALQARAGKLSAAVVANTPAAP